MRRNLEFDSFHVVYLSYQTTMSELRRYGETFWCSRWLVLPALPLAMDDEVAS